MLNSWISWFTMNIFVISAFALSRRGYEARDTCGTEVSAKSWHSNYLLLCGCLNSNWCPHPTPCCPMSHIDWNYLSNNFPVLYKLSSLALEGACMAVWPKRREGEKDNDSSAVPDNRKFIDLICATLSFKIFPFINSSWFGRAVGGGNTLLKEPIPE